MTYDVTNEESFEHVEEWLHEVNKHAPEKIVKLLVGNKADLANRKVISTERAQEFADKHGLLFRETSAKLSTNVQESFTQLALKLMEVSGYDPSASEVKIAPPPPPVDKCEC
jgi:GTPase SAR1 family protein